MRSAFICDDVSRRFLSWQKSHKKYKMKLFVELKLFDEVARSFCLFSLASTCFTVMKGHKVFITQCSYLQYSVVCSDVTGTIIQCVCFVHAWEAGIPFFLESRAPFLGCVSLLSLNFIAWAFTNKLKHHSSTLRFLPENYSINHMKMLTIGQIWFFFCLIYAYVFLFPSSLPIN